MRKALLGIAAVLVAAAAAVVSGCSSRHNDVAPIPDCVGEGCWSGGIGPGRAPDAGVEDEQVPGADREKVHPVGFQVELEHALQM